MYFIFDDYETELEKNAVRAVFFIDPRWLIRAIIYYPLSLGRNFEELKRAFLCETDANWEAYVVAWISGQKGDNW